MAYEILLLSLGWLLGLLSPSVVRAVERRVRAREIGRGLLSELIQLRHTLAAVAFKLRIRHGSLDQGFLNWYKERIASDDEISDDPALKQALETPATLLNQLPAGKSRPGFAPRSVTYHLPFLDTQLGNLDLFPVRFQKQMLRVRYDLSLFNEEVALAKTMFDKMLDSPIDGANRAAVEHNLEAAYQSMGIRAERLARDIDKIIDEFATKYGAA